ncbi:MAG TPA: SRPBCC domain-containing protein [Caulobacteraceae bacterium]|nr:SRPBCC domain-containing protein [Caulobacteraceae bacterium]
MAQLARFIDRFTVEFVRQYPHPIERVWRALSDPDELRAWCMPATIDLRVGGAYAFQGERWGQIVALEPPRLVRFGKQGIGPASATSDNWMQYELTPNAGGTQMRFVEHWQEGPDYLAWAKAKFGQEGDDLPGGPHSPFHPGTLGGWHGMFDALADVLDGVPADSRLPDSRLGGIVAKWAAARVRAGDFDAGVAERYVRQLRGEEAHLDLVDVYRAHIGATLPVA